MIAVETRTVEVVVPADPANLDSEAKVRGLGIWDCCGLANKSGSWVVTFQSLGEPWDLRVHFSSTVSVGCINVPPYLLQRVTHPWGILPDFRLGPCHCF